MKNPLVGVIVVTVVLSFPAAARADIPPPPPAGLDHPPTAPTLAPFPIAAAGVAAALAVGMGGVVLARSRRGRGVRIAALAGALVILLAAGIGAFWAVRAVQNYDSLKRDYDSLKAHYDDELSHWHPLGPPPQPPRYDKALLAAAAFAVAPQDGFPSGVPWGALARIYEPDVRNPRPGGVDP